jgi:hypothetical protein
VPLAQTWGRSMLRPAPQSCELDSEDSEMNTTQEDIRRLLRSFGIQADETIQAHVKSAKGVEALRFRLVLEDVTDYGGTKPEHAPRLLELEGEVHA